MELQTESDTDLDPVRQEIQWIRGGPRRRPAAVVERMVLPLVGTPQRPHQSGCCEVVEYSLSTDTDPEGVFQSLFGKDP